MENALTPMLAKAKNDIKEGFKLAVDTTRAFNSACLWSLATLPHPEHAGDYSWFSLWSLHNMGKTQPRLPWHHHLDIQEAADVFRHVQSLITAGITAQQFGAELDIEKLKAGGVLLSPAQVQTLEGLKVFFPRLYRQDMDGLEEGELNLSPAPSQGDLDILQEERKPETSRSRGVSINIWGKNLGPRSRPAISYKMPTSGFLKMQKCSQNCGIQKA